MERSQPQVCSSGVATELCVTDSFGITFKFGIFSGKQDRRKYKIYSCLRGRLLVNLYNFRCIETTLLQRTLSF